MSNSNRNQDALLSSISPVIDLDSTNDDSVVILDDSVAADALFAGGDAGCRPKSFATPKANSNDFIRNEALATSTPAGRVEPAAVRRSGEKRKRAEEDLNVVQFESGSEDDDEDTSLSSVATDKTAFLTVDETSNRSSDTTIGADDTTRYASTNSMTNGTNNDTTVDLTNDTTNGANDTTNGANDSTNGANDTTNGLSTTNTTNNTTNGRNNDTTNETTNTTINVDTKEGAAQKPQGTYDEVTGMLMPDTVTVLTTPDGSRVYLVGTAHFSKESQDDVSMVIRAVRPHIVCLELCKARTNILQMDEKTILEEAKNINFDKVRHAIQQNGALNGLMYILLLNMSAHLTRELGMAPGGEFRRALAEVRQLNTGCMIHLSDRPIKITIKRALQSLSWWQTAKLTWHLVMSKEPISKEDVERCKQRDLLEQMLKEMAGEFPQLGSVFVHERDIFLTHSLRLAALPDPTGEPTRVVGVVGIGHVPGIVANWNSVTQADVDPLMLLPPPSLSGRVVKVALKLTLAGVVLWAAYRVLPRPRFLTR